MCDICEKLPAAKFFRTASITSILSKCNCVKLWLAVVVVVDVFVHSNLLLYADVLLSLLIPGAGSRVCQFFVAFLSCVFHVYVFSRRVFHVYVRQYAGLARVSLPVST